MHNICPTQVHIDVARQHIEQGEFIAELYAMDADEIHSAYRQVKERIAEIKEGQLHVLK